MSDKEHSLSISKLALPDFHNAPVFTTGQMLFWASNSSKCVSRTLSWFLFLQIPQMSLHLSCQLEQYLGKAAVHEALLACLASARDCCC